MSESTDASRVLDVSAEELTQHAVGRDLAKNEQNRLPLPEKREVSRRFLPQTQNIALPMIHSILRLGLACRYRIHAIGKDGIPRRGAVLLLGNHVSWIDWAIIQSACRRPIRFVMHSDIYARWYLKWVFDLVGVVPIGGSQSKSALKRINAFLKAGEVVCLFPEGSITRNGQLGEFQRGYEKAVAGLDGVILPFYLRGLWGSRFSRAGAKLRENRPRGVRRDITVAIGKALPLETAAPEVKKRVRELSVSTWEQYARLLEPLPLAWFRTAKRLKNAMCVADTDGQPISNHKTLTAVVAFGRLMAKRSPEQNIGLLLPSTSAGVVANMAALGQGKTVVNLNYTASLSDLSAAVTKAEIRSIYTSHRFLERLQQRGIDLTELATRTQFFYLEDLKKEINITAKLAILLLVKVLPARLLYALFGPRTQLEDPAAILFSSGSEDEPKGVVLTHKNIMSNVKQVAEVVNAQGNDVMMGALPMFHAFGLTATSLLPLIEGIPLVCHPDPTDTVNVAKGISKYRATVLCASSSLLHLYVRNQRVNPLMFESLRLVIAGAEKLSQNVRDSFQLKFNKSVYEGYGATETAPVTSSNVPDHVDTTSWRVQIGNKPGTVGMPLPGTDVRVVDPETLEDLSVGQQGLVLISGPQVMASYLNDPSRTEQVLVKRAGIFWYKSGDKGYVDEDGFLTIVDRYSRFAKIGGEMVSLTAVEEHVRQVLNDGVDIVAVSIPDPRKGEKVVLIVTEQIDEKALRSRLVEARCNPLMIPSAAYFVPEIPRLGSGKTDLKAAKSLAMALSHPVEQGYTSGEVTAA